jgi:hypothetical protein
MLILILQLIDLKMSSFEQNILHLTNINLNYEKLVFEACWQKLIINRLELIQVCSFFQKKALQVEGVNEVAEAWNYNSGLRGHLLHLRHGEQRLGLQLGVSLQDADEPLGLRV